MVIDFNIINYANGQNIFHREYFQYVLVISGKGTIKIGTTELALLPHNILSLPAGELADLLVESDNGIVLGLMQLRDMLITQTTPGIFPASQSDLIRRLFYLGMDIEGMQLPRKTAVKSALNHLIFETITSMGLIVSDVNPVISAFIDDMTSNYTNPEYDYTSLISESGYSINHFRKLFKETIGVTPITFLHNLKIDYAKALMRRHGDELTIKEIAEKCGFKDPYYFSRLFKKIEKISPIEYLNSITE